LHVMCRIITCAEPEFVTTVTVNNNRQNPVEPWNLRANDRIQLELADKFKDEVSLFYERQENAFRNLTDEDVDELEVEGDKPIELYRLGQTFAVVDGEIDKLSRMREVFEDERRKWLLDLATPKSRLILSELISDKLYKEKVDEDNYTFLKTTAAFKKAMDIAYKKYKWTVRGLS